MLQLQLWFNNLKSHEQLMLVGCGALLAGYLLYLLIWSPLTASQSNLLRQNQEARETLMNVRELAAEYKQLLVAGASATPTSRGNLSRTVDSSVARNGLAMRRYQPSAGGGAQVRFENVEFSNLLGWLYELESQHSVMVKDLSVTTGNAGGRVNVSVRLDQLK